MVLETKAGMEAGVIGAGHRFAASRLDAQRTTAGWVSEQMGGLSYLTFIRQLLSRVESDWDSVKVSSFQVNCLPGSKILLLTDAEQPCMCPCGRHTLPIWQLTPLHLPSRCKCLSVQVVQADFQLDSASVD